LCHSFGENLEGKSGRISHMMPCHTDITPTQIKGTCKDHHGMLIITVSTWHVPSGRKHRHTSDITVASYQVQNSSRYSFPVSSKVQDNIWDRKARYKVQSGLEWTASKRWLTLVRGCIYVFTRVCSPCSLLGRTTTDEVVWMSTTHWHKTKVLQFYIQFIYIIHAFEWITNTYFSSLNRESLILLSSSRVEIYLDAEERSPAKDLDR